MNDFDFKYQDSKREVKRELPQLVPVLPVRNTVLFPSTARKRGLHGHPRRVRKACITDYAVQVNGQAVE
jgi:hypothetical protein